MRTMDACAFRRFASLFSWRMILVRKPDTTFRDHARTFVVRFVVIADLGRSRAARAIAVDLILRCSARSAEPRRMQLRRLALILRGSLSLAPQDEAMKSASSAPVCISGRARLPALRCGACPGERTPGLSPGRASREREDAGVTRTIDRA